VGQVILVAFGRQSGWEVLFSNAGLRYATPTQGLSGPELPITQVPLRVQRGQGLRSVHHRCGRERLADEGKEAALATQGQACGEPGGDLHAE
jgi:hypothetical protein